MFHRRVILPCLLLLCALPLAAKDKKKKVLLTDDILQARTVYVIADPKAGVDLSDPLAQRNARLNVEDAFRKWGRFQLATDPYYADLIIMVRHGNGKIAKETVGGLPISNDPVMMQAPVPGNMPDNGPVNRTAAEGPLNPRQPVDPSPQLEVGNPDDMFSVFRGNRNSPFDYPAVWKYSAKDALRAPSVRAVEEFRKLIEEAEKQRADTP
jgi:hypothetical protein